jgi:biotin carboxyl carrier protein
MKYFVNVNGRPIEVEIVDRAGKAVVTIDGKRADFSYEEVDSEGQVALVMDECGYAVSVAGKGNDYHVTLAGHAYAVEIEDERERAAHAAARDRGKGGGIVKAVMPGIVVELCVAVGDTVAEGQSLLILEAMKMQNEIGAPSEGLVKRVLCTAGEAVSAGAKLIELEALPDE